MLYGEDSLEINALFIEENEVDLDGSESGVVVDGWSHSGKEIGSLRIESCEKETSADEFYTAIEAEKMNNENLDMRPYLHDKLSGDHLLLDTGAAVTAYPPEPGDKPDPRVNLKAINGTRLKTYGTKKVDIKIGRKLYSIDAIKTDVQHPVLGYDMIMTSHGNTNWFKIGQSLVMLS